MDRFFSLSPSAAWLCSWHVTCSQTSTHITQGSLPALSTCWESIIMMLKRWRRASHVLRISSNSCGGPWLKISTTYTSRCFRPVQISRYTLSPGTCSESSGQVRSYDCQVPLLFSPQTEKLSQQFNYLSCFTF